MGVFISISSIRSAVRLLPLPVGDDVDMHSAGRGADGMIVFFIGIFVVIFECNTAVSRDKTANYYTGTWKAIGCTKAHFECLAAILTLRVGSRSRR
jgi:hypothetical protein